MSFSKTTLSHALLIIFCLIILKSPSCLFPVPEELPRQARLLKGLLPPTGGLFVLFSLSRLFQAVVQWQVLQQ